MYELRVISGEPDVEKRCCADCKYLKAAVSWWCTSKNAIDVRGTSIPGVKNCPYWKPAKKASFLERVGLTFHILIRC
jgi:hypothetical protein